MNLATASREDLIEHVRFLQSELGISIASTDLATISRRFKLTPSHAKLMLALYQAKGRVLSLQQLMDATGSEADTTKTITVMICQIRDKCGRDRDVIITHPGFGYAISPHGAALIEQGRGGA